MYDASFKGRGSITRHIHYIIWLNTILCKYLDIKIHAPEVLTAPHSSSEAD